MTFQTAAPQDVLDAVTSVMAQVLERDIAPDESFFDAGGHSVLVIEVIARLREEHGIAVPARQFLDDPSPQAVAAVVEAGGRA